MIIQESKIPISIPKEFMSIYTSRQLSEDIIPKYRIPVYRTFVKKSDDTGYYPCFTWTVTNSNYKTSDQIAGNTFGFLYQQSLTMDSEPVPDEVNPTLVGAIYVKVFDQSVLEYRGNPSSDDTRSPYYTISHTTDSNTGVEKKTYHYYGMMFGDDQTVPDRQELLGHTVFKFPNPNMTFSEQIYMDHTSIVSTSDEITVYFTFQDGVSYSPTIMNVGFTKKGTGSKNTVTYNFYLDNTALKTELATLADSYTTVNLYHLDETPWS